MLALVLGSFGSYNSFLSKNRNQIQKWIQPMIPRISNQQQLMGIK